MDKRYKIGSVVFNNWVIVDTKGEGSFGKVFEIQRKDGFTTEHSALKVITVPKNESELQHMLESGKTTKQAERYLYDIVESIVNEIKIMSKLKATANVVSYEDHEIIPHEDGMGWDILIRMELLHPLLEYAYEHPFSRRDIINLGIHMCHALELCQKNNIIHRDIKPENIFVSDNGDFKLGDFGIARTIEKSSSDLTKTGTYTYMAPEVFRGEDYGFSVDIYSLGIVLYRLINKNRTPFLPESPQGITPRDEEAAQVRRMRGDTIPRPFYSEGRLPEIVQKACSPEAKDRYSSPMQMRQELEAILYDVSDSAQIYPDGDTLEIMRNYYATRGKRQDSDAEERNKTDSAFSRNGGQRAANSIYSTISGFGKKGKNQGGNQGDDFEEGTLKAFRHVRKTPAKDASRTSPTEETSVKGKLVAGILAVLLIAGGVTGFAIYRNNKAKDQAELETHYQELMKSGMDIVGTDPEQAQKDFQEAQEIHPEDPAPFVSYSYAIYMAGDYDRCITYIEDELGLGKQYDTDVQSQLSEILAASYFEREDYVAAASFFRLSTAGGDITVSAMRDYAVSLGRIGDIEEADRVLQRMFDAGAQEDATNYVQAEVDYALRDYLSAESGFAYVLDNTEDVVLQKRALRSLAEVYRDCAGLARTGNSPIYSPATKEVELLSNGIVKFELRYDSTLWEMLAMAYFESYHTDTDVSPDYLMKAAECFDRVIELGISKPYLYNNLYTVYYEQKDYESAEQALDRYEAAFSDDYMPHALRAMMLITIENEKGGNNRDYSSAYDEYVVAGDMIRSSDDATYYQQLESLITQLEQQGWL